MSLKNPTIRERWFLDRIGRRVFRNNDFCTCSICLDVYQNGLVIADEYHALYLAEIESVSQIDKDPASLKYFDTKEDVIEYEKSLKNTRDENV